MTQKLPKIIVIGGPTASGKTSLAIELALRLNGEIVNADSMQVYRYMDIGTAKPSFEERAVIPHHLMDVVDPDEEFNAARYCQMAKKVIEQIRKKNKIVFLVGGTGLYIKALLAGLFISPPSNPEIRKRLYRRWKEEGAGNLYEQLKKKDPEAAERIHPHDRLRIIRALEVMELTKKRFTDLTGEHGFREKEYQALKLAIYTERNALYQLINQRSLDMIESGLVKETEDLLNKGYSTDLKPMKSIGYRHAAGYLSGKWDIDRMIYLLQRDTRHYAKRQLTWFRADPDVKWINHKQRGVLDEMISSFLSNKSID